MTHWTDICCALDFSQHSRAAFERAVELASQLEADLTLLHVCAPSFPGADVVFAVGEPADGLAEGPVQARLDAWRREAEHALGRTVRLELLTGNPAREISRFSSGVDVLVVGTRGATGLGRLLLGSVAERVVRDATCPVLVVHQQEMAAPESRAAAP